MPSSARSSLRPPFRAMEPVGDVESHDSSSSSGLERRRRRSSALILVVILVLTIGLFGTLTLVPALMASGLLAYSFGLRHAFDVDHIAAIDNITRKLTVRQSSPHTVGMFFALGHSLAVFLACCGILVTKSFMKSMLSTFHAYGKIFGLAISASFLLALGILNLCTARQLWMEWKGHASDHSRDATMGLWLSCCPRLFQAISKPWHMLIVGFLFGLGFDTATEVGLLGVEAVSHGLAAPIYILLLPFLFMSGMCLLDTLNGLMMAWIYRTSAEDDKKKIYFNLFVTVTSGLVAFLVGLIEMLGFVAERAHLQSWFFRWIQSANDHSELLGAGVVLIFLVAMAVALCCFRRVFGQSHAQSSVYRRERSDSVQNELQRW
ncbi:hoxN [Symbiodinium sp. CCMP2592]|nr:hoxN [Symbiodinium sp. CCMP2592]